MKKSVKSAGFKTIATLSIIVASQVGVFAASTANNGANEMSTASVVGGVALIFAAIVAPLFKSTKSVGAVKK